MSNKLIKDIPYFNGVVEIACFDIQTVKKQTEQFRRAIDMMIDITLGFETAVKAYGIHKKRCPVYVDYIENVEYLEGVTGMSWDEIKERECQA